MDLARESGWGCRNGKEEGGRPETGERLRTSSTTYDLQDINGLFENLRDPLGKSGSDKTRRRRRPTIKYSTSLSIHTQTHTQSLLVVRGYQQADEWMIILEDIRTADALFIIRRADRVG